MNTISELGARWAVRADAGVLCSDEQSELDAWLAADSRHRGAYVRARAQWVDLDRLAALRGPANGSSVEGRPADAVQAEEPGCRQTAAETGVTVKPEPPASALSRRRLLAASVAAVSALAGGLPWILFREGREEYASGIGEVRRISLEDGSTLMLNTSSNVTVRLTKRQRDIRLVRGEALFEVAHDKSRPFIVHANDTAVRAVGTAFAVRLEAAQVDVTVTEGVVEVADSKIISGLDPIEPTTPRLDVKRVVAHERVLIARAPSRLQEVELITPAEVDRQLAWREGMVSFDGESLQTAVAEINRHNRRQIVIEDLALRQLPVVGLFRATDLDGFSAAAAVALNARAVPDGEVIRLQRKTLHSLN